MLLAQTADSQSAPLAQTTPATREEENRAKRESKALRSVPPQRPAGEVILYEIDENLLIQRILNPPRGIHARMGGIGEAADRAVVRVTSSTACRSTSGRW